MSDQGEQQKLAFDPAALARLYADIARKSSELLGQFAKRPIGRGMPAFSDELGITKAFFEAWAHMLADPMRMAETQMKLWQDYWSLWQRSMLKLMGQDTHPVVETARGDRRFRHQDWQNVFLYDYVKQSYLIAAKHLHESLAGVQGLDQQTAKKSRFLHAAVHRRAFAVQFRADESRSDARNHRDQRPESPQGFRKSPRGPHPRQRRETQIENDRRARIQARRKYRGHARQSRLPERSDAVDPVRARHRSRSIGGRCSSFRRGSTSTTFSTCARKTRS